MVDGVAAEAGEVMGVLVRELDVRLLNCSRGGCLLETKVPMEVGAVGSLGITFEGHDLLDHLVVVRCQRIEGAGSVYHVGARFLWLGSVTDSSLRIALPKPTGN
jgi:hypothetical protein